MGWLTSCAACWFVEFKLKASRSSERDHRVVVEHRLRLLVIALPERRFADALATTADSAAMPDVDLSAWPSKEHAADAAVSRPPAER